MPVTTTTQSWPITVPAAMTINDTIHMVTLPGVPADCSGLPNPAYPNPGFGINADNRRTILGFKGPSANKVGFVRNSGSESKLIGRYSLFPATSSGFSRHGVSVNAGYGIRPSNYGQYVESIQWCPLQTWPLKTLFSNKAGGGVYDYINKFNHQIEARIVSVGPKPTGENCSNSQNRFYKKTTGATVLYTQDPTLTGYDQVEMVGNLLNSPTNGLPGTTVAFVSMISERDAASLNLFSNSPPTGALWKESETLKVLDLIGSNVGYSVFSNADRSSIGSFSTIRHTYIGYLVKYVAPNIYYVLVDGATGFGTSEDTIRSIAGVDLFTLMHLPGTASNPSFFRGNLNSISWHSKIIAHELTDQMTLAERNYRGANAINPIFDNIYKTRKYVRAPYIIGSCDGGDFAIDAQIPAPFGNVRIVYSPSISANNYQDEYQSAVDSLINYVPYYQTLSSIYADTIGSGTNLYEVGACIYEPHIVEKVTASTVPSNYVSSVKRRPVSMKRAGSNVTTLLSHRQTQRYGGGAFGDGMRNTEPSSPNTMDTDAAVDLSTIPGTFTVNVLHKSSAAPPASVDIQWALWDAVSESWLPTGATANIALSETYVNSIGETIGRFTGATPAPPTANRQASPRLSVSGFIVGIGVLAGSSTTVITEVTATPTPTRRRIWPYLITKNKLLGSDATVVPAENLGAVWSDPDPQPIVTVTGDWILGWSSNRITFSAASLSLACTNRALAPEAGTLTPLSQPTAILVRQKGTTAWIAPNSNFDDSYMQTTEGMVGVPPNRTMRHASGTVLVVKVITVVRWQNKIGLGVYGSSTAAAGNNSIDQDIATTFVREYEVTKP